MQQRGGMGRGGSEREQSTGMFAAKCCSIDTFHAAIKLPCLSNLFVLSFKHINQCIDSVRMDVTF